MKYIPLLLALFFVSGCSHSTANPVEEPALPQTTIESMAPLATIVYPIDDYVNRTTFKLFNQEVHDRFNGWHVADDLEITEDELEKDIPVYAIADGKVIYRNWLSGYGGVLILQHEIDGQRIQSLYGHINLNDTRPQLGEFVRIGTKLATLGADKSIQTDNERKHLHFALYPGTTLRLNGYEPSPANIDNWINPTKYLEQHDAKPPSPPSQQPDDWKEVSLSDISDLYSISLSIPNNWEAVFQPANESISLLNAEHTGGPLDSEPADSEPAELLIRYFDATDFLTLSTVTIHERHLRSIQNHDAVDYLIEKKPWVEDFPNQPAWRNTLHQVTDIRTNDGFSRFYVIAQNPELDKKTIDYILNSIKFKE